MKERPAIILGSASKHRAECLAEQEYEVTQVASGFDEESVNDQTIERSVILAREKNRTLEKMLKEKDAPPIPKCAFLLTADLIVMVGEHIYEKPGDRPEHMAWIQTFCATVRPIRVIAALALKNLKTGAYAEGKEIAEIHFKRIPPKALRLIGNCAEFRKCGGGFAVQHELWKPFIEVRKGNVDAVIGMPMKLFEELLKQVT